MLIHHPNIPLTLASLLSPCAHAPSKLLMYCFWQVSVTFIGAQGQVAAQAICRLHREKACIHVEPDAARLLVPVNCPSISHQTLHFGATSLPSVMLPMEEVFVFRWPRKFLDLSLSICSYLKLRTLHIGINSHPHFFSALQGDCQRSHLPPFTQCYVLK